jgi:hypothetical protein
LITDRHGAENRFSVSPSGLAELCHFASEALLTVFDAPPIAERVWCVRHGFFYPQTNPFCPDCSSIARPEDEP